MKKIYSLLSLLLLAVCSVHAQSLPEFSTVNDPVYYSVQFTGGFYINVPSDGAAFVTSEDNSSDGSLWAFIGTQDGFKMLSKSGQYASTKAGKATNGQDCPNMFYGVSTEDEAKSLKFYTVNGAIEIGLTTDNNMGMNSWGGPKVNMSVGMWDHGDKNNKLLFVKEGEEPPAPELGFKFSTPEDMHYYTIRNVNNPGTYAHYDGTSNYLQLNGEVDKAAAFYFEEAPGSKGEFVAVYVRAYNATDLYMNDFNSWSTTKKVWYVREATQTGVAGCYNICNTMTNVDSDNTTCWNHQSGGVKAWKASNDKGSAWYFESVNPAELLTSEYASVKTGKRPTDISPLSLWYDFPATITNAGNKWMEYGLPLGNGEIGTVLLGGVLKDQIQFNNKTLYDGTPTAFGNHGAYANFGNFNVTDLSKAFSTDDNSKPVLDYARYLDIENGVAGVNYSSETTNYTRRYFTSAPDKVFVIRYTAEGSDKLTLRFAFDPDKYIGAGTPKYKNNGGAFEGKGKTVTYGAQFRVISADGTITAADNGVTVTDATEVLVLMTNYTNCDMSLPSCVNGTQADVNAEISARLQAAEEKGYEALYADHVANFSALMGRCTLQLGNAASTRTTNKLIDYYNASAANKTKAEGLFLEQLYFQWGRYLTIACNNINTQVPANLQGIWNNNTNTNFWHSDIHADVNVQMCYWPSEITNLSEMHLPYLDNIIYLSEDSRNYHSVAQRFKSTARGWMLPTENNIYGGCSSWEWNKMKTMSAWYCTHLWQHYRYTLDKDFLKRALPAVLRAAQFVKDISTSKNTDGTVYVADEYSPEHGPSGHATAFAQQNAAEVVNIVLKGHETLGEESPISEQDYQEMADFYPTIDKGLHTEQYGGNTCLREWYDLTLNSQGDAAGHRHLSHLMALYPFGQVNGFSSDPEEQKLFNAAVNSLHVRNAKNVTGWSAGHKVNLHARALEGDAAHEYFDVMLRHSTAYTIQMSGQGGLYYNLWDSHSPFQIDGNFGYCSGVAEMLMQSYDDCIHVLPALPSVWKDGSVKGLKAVGGFIVNIDWQAGKPTKVEVENPLGQPLRIQSDVDLTTVRVENEEGQPLTVERNGNVYTILLPQGEKAVIAYKETPTAIQGMEASATFSDKLTYDLNGRIARSNATGVLIQDGRKIMIK